MIQQILKRATFWLALGGLALLLGLIRSTNARPPMPEPLLPPAQKPYPHGLGASGIIEAIHENTRISAPLPGLVTELSVKVRDTVKPGDVLLKLDDREVRALLPTQQAELALRRAELARARRQHDRLARLGSAAIAREEVEKRADEIPVAEAAEAAARAAIRQTRDLLDRYIVRAPIHGTVLQVNTRPGEYLSPGDDTAALVIGSLQELQVRVDVDEQLAPRVRENARASAFRKGATTDPMPLEFIRIEPFIIPKRNLTGGGTERVDTRVLPVIFRLLPHPGIPAYVGQQVDVFIEEESAPPEADN